MSVPAADDGSAFLLAEYKELRAEILKRSEMQHQLISFALAALGALVTVGLKEDLSALLVYPIVTLGLATGWAHHDLQIAQLGLYIRHRIEPRLAGPQGWEQTISTQVASKHIGRLAKLATRGIFWTSTLLTLLIYVVRRQPQSLRELWSKDALLLSASLLATVCIFVVMRNRDKQVSEIEQRMKILPGQRGAGG